MFSVTTIGTCRVHNTMRAAATVYPIENRNPRFYGFTHSSREALQQLDFYEGGLDLPAYVTPAVFREGSSPDDYREQWIRPDLMLVELSSAKLTSAAGFPIQVRYLAQHLPDFFANPERVRSFWSTAERNPAALKEMLEAEPAFQVLSIEDRQLLESIRLEHQTYAGLLEDCAQLVDRIGRDRIVFVTHVNADGAGGKPIPARERLIGWVERAAAELHARCFNPTGVMKQFGQELAMQQSGKDTTHYTEAFETLLYAQLHTQFVAPELARLGGDDDSSAQARLQLLAASISATMNNIDLVEGSRQLHAALRDNPEAEALIELRGILRERLGDFEGAVADLGGRQDQGPSARESLMRSALALNRPADALEIAEQLLSEEHESDGVHRAAAEAAGQLGLAERRLSHLKQLFRIDRSNVPAALEVLAMLADDPAAKQEWIEELACFADDNVELAQALIHHALNTQDEVLFSRSFATLAASQPAAAGNLVEQASDRLLMVSAGSLGSLLESGELQGRPARRLKEIIRAWGAKGLELAEAGQFDAASEYVRAALISLPNDGAGKRAQRLLAVQMINRCRPLAAERRFGELIEFCRANEETAISSPRVAQIYIRALETEHDLPEAARVVEAACQIHVQDASILSAGVRVFQKAGEWWKAAKACQMLERSDGAHAAADEIAAFWQRGAPRVLRQIRQMTEAGEFGEALSAIRAIDGRGLDDKLVARERAILHRAMFLAIRNLDRSGGEGEKRYYLARMLAEDSPDERNVKQAAAEAVRRREFSTALDLWNQAAAHNPASELAVSEVSRFQALVGARGR